MSISFIGSTVSVAASVSASEDPSDYALVSVTEIGKIISVGELGDNAEDITFDLLKTGRRSRVTGVKDLGAVPIAIEYDRDDAGLTILEAGNNGNTTHTFKIVDTDGDTYYFQGLIANLKDNQRAANGFKGLTFEARGQTGVTKVDGS